jgi:hypothetical protein
VSCSGATTIPLGDIPPGQVRTISWQARAGNQTGPATVTVTARDAAGAERAGTAGIQIRQ